MPIDLSSNPQYIVIRDVCERLDRAGLQYMLTGSMALCYFAEPRFTRDIDIVIDLEPGDSKAFVRLFSPDYYLDEDAVRNAIQNRGMFNALHVKEAFKIDFIVRKKTIFHHTHFTRRKQVSFNGISTWIISKEDLILSKLVWAKESHSETQLRDIKNLLTTGYDQAYVAKWVGTLALEGILTRAQRYE